MANIVSFGASSSASGNSSVAIGKSSSSSGDSCVAIGPGVTASGASSVSIGGGISNTVANTTQIGNNSLESFRTLDPATGNFTFRTSTTSTSASAAPILTATQLVSGQVSLTNTGSIAITTDSGANLDTQAQLAGNLYDGQTFETVIAATTGGTIASLTGGSGVTVVSTGAGGNVLRVRFYRTGTNAWSAYVTQVATSGLTAINDLVLQGNTTNTASATGTYAIAEGHNTTSAGNQAISIGGSAVASQGATASAQGAIAIGGTNTSGNAGAAASGANSVAIGSGSAATAGAVASGTDGIAIGRAASAVSTGGIAVGASSVAGGNGSTVIGVGATDASFANSIVLGNGAASTVAGQMVLGTLTNQFGTIVTVGKVPTTNATPVAVYSLAMSLNTVITLEYVISAFNTTTGVDYGSYAGKIQSYCPPSGTLVITQFETLDSLSTGMGGTTVTASSPGTAFFTLVVTGLASTNINWTGMVRVVQSS